jgi:hypothetical protein
MRTADRWNQLKTLKAHLSVTGGIWHVKGKSDVLKDIRIELPLHEQRLITHLVGQNRRFVFTPHQVSVEDEQGNLIEKRDDPRHASRDRVLKLPGMICTSHISTAMLCGHTSRFRFFIPIRDL